MDNFAIQRLHRVTALMTFCAIVFYVFFQINKGEPFRDINPFGEDPYDAIGSFAIQIALLIGILTYARALRLRDDSTQADKARFIRRGNYLVLAAILVTLGADAIAEIVHPFPPSYWGNVLLGELALMFVLAFVCVIALVVVFAAKQTPAPARNLTPADAIDDLWTLVRVPATKLNSLLPRVFIEWLRRANSDWLFARVQWLNPRAHPWRFACALGLFVGVALTLAQWQEGLPPSLIGLIVAGIFISAEFVATIVGFALLGGYLGLRPAFRKNK